MKGKLLLLISITYLLYFPRVIFGQAPDLGAASRFALFTATGEFTNTDSSHVTGDIGSYSYSVTGFPPGTVEGIIHFPPDAILTQAATDVLAAYGSLSTLGGFVLGVIMGNGQILSPGIYQTGAASSLTGNLTLDGQGNPNALFIIRIGGALTTSTNSNVILINSAALCNVYWQINGAFDLGNYSVFRGTVIANGAISLLEGASLLGRGLSTAGAIEMYNNLVINPLVASAGTIAGTATVCQGQTAVIYSVLTILNATDYIWTLPYGANIIAGDNTNTITVDFSMTSESGDITVQGSNNCGTGTVSANYYVTVNPLSTTSLIWHW
jgi:hypothetical protein